jgi:hypothetical protein
MRNFHGLKPQDIMLMMKLLVEPDLPQNVLANELSISTAEVSHGLKRLKVSQLMLESGPVNKSAAIELLLHAIKYFFPPEFGTISAGIPTSYAKPGFKFVRYNNADIYVWPHPEGTRKGICLRPIHPSLPQACLKDDNLYTLASLVEMVRMGRAREVSIASKEIEKLIKAL